MLNSYTNLKYLSRDRGKEYQALSSAYEHIADRFHLIKNLSELIMREIKKILPHRIKFSTEVEEVKPIDTEIVLTNATEKKIKLIREVKTLYESGCCLGKLRDVLV